MSPSGGALRESGCISRIARTYTLYICVLYSYKYHQRDESDNTHAATLAENTTTEIKINYIINEILDVNLSMIQMHTSAIMGSAALIIDLNNCINWLGGSKVYALKVN